MDILILAFTVSSLRPAQAAIWLTINEQKVSYYSTSDKDRSPITILCHLRTNTENISSWVYRVRSISKTNTTDMTSVNDLSSANEVWNDTYERPDNSFPKIYVDRRRTTFANRLQMTQYYFATGYTIIAPITNDSGVYRCRGDIVSNRQKITEESERVTLVITRDAGPTTIMTFNENEASLIEIQQLYRQTVRCHTFIPDEQATVLYHRVYKAQNITRRNSNNEVEVSMTEWLKIYEFNESRFQNAAENKQLSNQDLTSGFDLPSPGFSDTGLYFCSAVYKNRNQVLRTVNSSTVYVDARGSPYTTLSIENEKNYEKSCIYDWNDALVSNYLCDKMEEDQIMAICRYWSVDFIPEVQLTVGNGSTAADYHEDFESEDYYLDDHAGPFHAIQFEGIIVKKFRASEICSFPEVSCSVALPGSPDRTRRRTAILISDFCEKDYIQSLRSQGHLHHRVPSMFFISFATVCLTPYFNMKIIR